jgi:hypothetical protein
MRRTGSGAVSTVAAFLGGGMSGYGRCYLVSAAVYLLIHE